MESGLFYTFSTIAQTLAGALAILGAFLLFHMGQIAARMDDNLNKLKDMWRDEGGRPLEAEPGVEAKGAVGLLDYFDKDSSKLDDSVGRGLKESTRKLLDRRNDVMEQVARVSVVTVVTLVASFIMLALTPAIMQLPFGCRATVFTISCAVGIFAAGYCLVRYAQLVRTLLSEWT